MKNTNSDEKVREYTSKLCQRSIERLERDPEDLEGTLKFLKAGVGTLKLMREGK